MSEIQWSALVLLALGCATAQLKSGSDEVLGTSMTGLVLALVSGEISTEIHAN